jgi:hypothetical protein
VTMRPSPTFRYGSASGGARSGEGRDSDARLPSLTPTHSAYSHAPYCHFLPGRSFRISFGVIHMKWSGLQESDFTARG